MNNIYDAETGIIGSLVIDFERCEKVFSSVSPDDFQIKELGEIFAAFRANREKICKDTVYLWECLTPKLRDVALEAAEMLTSVSMIDDYAQIVRANAQKERVRESLTRIIMNAGDNILSETKSLIECEEKLAEDNGYQTSINDSLKSFIEELYSENELRIFTGFEKLDRALGGLRMKTISYIGARPSTGKTAFALNILKRQECRCLLFSLEMSAPQIYERLASDICSINYGLINKRNLTDIQKADMVTAVSTVTGDDNLYINDHTYAVEAMEPIIQQYKPRLVIVDFMQFIKTNRKFLNRRNEIDYISGELKRIARQNNCHIMILSQLTRAGKERPTMSDLKESGALEQDGDYIILLHRPYVLDKTDDNPEYTEITIDKNKYGQTGMTKMCFQGEYQRFVALEERYG